MFIPVNRVWSEFFHGCLAVSLAVVSLAGAARAQEAVIDISKVGPDFQLVGEYAGTVMTGPQKFEQLFLQVRAVGQGNYEGAQYLGGLPLTPAEQRPLLRLTGRRSDQFLVLSGASWAVLAHPDHCLVIDPDGQRIGRLERMVRHSPSMGVKPPENALVLFDGSGTEQFSRAQMTDDGLLIEGANVKPLFHDFNMHLEFLVPFAPQARGQGRGNSGVYLQSSYEVQVLDSFALEPQHDGCGALYRFRPPEVNVCFPPLTWQTYDIAFTSPRWNVDGTMRVAGRVTVWLNGVKIQDDVELPASTGSGKEADPMLEPVRLQDHKNPVRYRNIWVIDRGIAQPEGFPILRDPVKEAAEKKAEEEAAKKAAEKAAKEAAEKKAQEEAKKAAEKAAKEAAAKEAAEKKAQAEAKKVAEKAAKEAAEKKAQEEAAAKEAAAKKAQEEAKKAAEEKAATEKAATEKAANDAPEKKAQEDAVEKAATQQAQVSGEKT